MAQICWDILKWYTSLISWDGGSTIYGNDSTMRVILEIEK